jgi:excisionase family DNA binding protein
MVSLPGVLFVADAAVRLGVDPSRVRQLARSGDLPAVRIGRQWLIDADAVDRRAGGGFSRPGRPLAPRSAWGLLVMADGQQPGWLDRVERSRIRRRLRELAADSDAGLGVLLRSRADVHRLYAHPGVLPRLLAEPGVVRSGASAVSEVGADLIAADLAEAYVSGKRHEQLMRRYRLRPADRPNLILRVPRVMWPFAPDQTVAPTPVVAADLLDAGDDRSRRAGRKLFADTVKGGPA